MSTFATIAELVAADALGRHVSLDVARCQQTGVLRFWADLRPPLEGEIHIELEPEEAQKLIAAIDPIYASLGAGPGHRWLG